MNQIERITEMENALNDASAAVHALHAALENYAAALPRLQALTAYYESPQWLDDMDDDRAGKLPANLLRGVLTEDAVYDLLTDQQVILKMMKALSAPSSPEHPSDAL